MSSGQSERNGNSVEPGLPNTLVMPKARSRSNVACLTVRGLVCLRDTSTHLSDDCCHCEERSDEAIQKFLRMDILDCFAALAMTGKEFSPRRVALHGGLAGGICGPQLQPRAVVAGIDRKFGAFEQRLHAAVGEFLRRRAAVQLCRKLDDERRLQRSVEDQPRVTLD